MKKLSELNGYRLECNTEKIEHYYLTRDSTNKGEFISRKDLRDWAIEIYLEIRNTLRGRKDLNYDRAEGIQEFLINAFELTEEDLK